jgi:hypothetical protein
MTRSLAALMWLAAFTASMGAAFQSVPWMAIPGIVGCIAGICWGAIKYTEQSRQIGEALDTPDWYRKHVDGLGLRSTWPHEAGAPE